MPIADEPVSSSPLKRSTDKAQAEPKSPRRDNPVKTISREGNEILDNPEKGSANETIMEEKRLENPCPDSDIPCAVTQEKACSEVTIPQRESPDNKILESPVKETPEMEHLKKEGSLRDCPEKQNSGVESQDNGRPERESPDKETPSSTEGTPERRSSDAMESSPFPGKVFYNKEEVENLTKDQYVFGFGPDQVC